ncbi:decarboxylase [Candidatus Pacearchaeota archaeon]|nr:decarboxylase [Candidatus Pacearchaeota archaeon]
MIKDKDKIFFFSQALSQDEISRIIKKHVKNFVIDNETDLKELIDFISKEKIKVNICLRMKIQEHRIGSGKYFIYGMPARKVNKIISEIKNNPFIDKIGIHIHRKSQNTSEWSIKAELEDSLTQDSLNRISLVNIGGGLPVEYKSYSSDVLPYIFSKIKEAREWLAKHNIKTYLEPGRFIAAPSVRLQAKIIQIYDSIIVLNCSLYNCALDTLLTNTKMLIDGELPDNSVEGQFYLIKGNTPTRDDIFRYKVKLKAPKVGGIITFLNAGAYNYTTDFCSLQKLKTEVVEEF